MKNPSSSTNIESEFSQTAASAGMIGLAAFAGSFIGFFLQLLVAFYFGASNQTDAYFMALSTSELLSKLLLGGSITAVFLPMFVNRLAHGQSQQAWQMALNLLHLTFLAFIVLLSILVIFASPFISFISPGFDSSTHELTTRLLLVLLPSFALLYLVELTTAMLQALHHFLIPSLLRIVSPCVSIIAILMLVKFVGIYALAVGVVVGSFIQLGILLTALHRQGFSYHFVFQPFDPAIKKLLYLTYPFLLSVLVTQGAGITYRILVSDLAPGSLAAIKFAEKITQLLTIIFLNSVTMVIYPIMSTKAARHDMIGMRDTISSSIRLIFFVTMPIITGVALLRLPIVSFIYQRGSFSATDAALTSVALLFLVIGLTTNGISSVLGHATLALQETRAAVAVTIASQAIAISLFVLLVPKLAHAGLALASSLVPLAIALLYFLYLTRFIPHLSVIFYHATYTKTAILALVMGILVFLVSPWSTLVTDHQQISLFLQILLPSIIGATFFLVGAYLWRIPELIQLLKLFRTRWSKLSTIFHRPS